MAARINVRPRTALAVAVLLGPAVVAASSRGDEPGRLGRLFRFGGASPASTTSKPAPVVEARPVFRDAGVPGLSPAGSATAGQPQPRLVPQPRVARSATDADPLVTRVAIGRSDDGTQFGMFLQVFADGTVVDSEGIHPLGREAVRPVAEALESGDLFRLKGHCGGPPTDFIEQVQVVVFERTMRGLKANAFSFSGNTQGCDHAVRHLQTVLDTLQAKLSRPASASRGTSAGPAMTSPASAGVAAPPRDFAPSSPPIRLNDGGGSGD